MSVWEALGDLDRSQPRVGEQLTSALRDAIDQGLLRPGTRLPSTRDVAAELGVSRGLVVGAYERLSAEGRLVARQGRGTLVAHQAEPPESPGRLPDRAGWPVGTGRASGRAFEITMATSSPAAAGAVPLRGTLLCPGAPNVDDFPRTAWRRAFERAVLVAADADLGYPDPAGAFRLRAELAAYLGRIRAAQVDVDRIVVTSGSTQALALWARVLRVAGLTQVAVEDPADVRMAACLAEYGLSVVGVPVDGDGIDVAALNRHDLRAVVTTPVHQYPLGVVLSPQRRAALVEWARYRGGLILEDDCDAEIYLDREPVGCLQGLAPEHVVLIGSVSRTLAPALRLGWLVAPRRLQEELRGAKALADGGGPALEQLALAELLATDGYDRHLRRVRRALRERRDVLVAALRERLPAARPVGTSAGLHLTVELPADTDDVDVAERAAAGGVAPLPLSVLRSHYRGAPGLVLGYAAHQPEELRQAVEVLAEAVAGAISGGRQPPDGFRRFTG